ncbi:hypothetical protein ILYODFUR_019734 [Ilyodon furcidens]|uniref:Uncharacterized protein n=1 Tax=Ilyodon furcidens TaxID=33524 RepID=A0ABV0UAN3_9TELE
MAFSMGIPSQLRVIIVLSSVGLKQYTAWSNYGNQKCNLLCKVGITHLCLCFRCSLFFSDLLVVNELSRQCGFRVILVGQPRVGRFSFVLCILHLRLIALTVVYWCPKALEMAFQTD